MTNREIYRKIVGKFSKQFPAVFDGLQTLFDSEKLWPEIFINYLSCCVEVNYKMNQKQEIDYFQYTFVASINALIIELINDGRFSKAEWEKCFEKMFKYYMQVTLDFLEEHKRKEQQSAVKSENLLPVKNPANTECPLVDGKKVSPNEAAFLDFCTKRFDELSWLRKLRIVYDSEFSKRLQKKYFGR